MKTLNPTLWRTCRVLSGATRLQLLRQLHDKPGQNITELAKAVGIGVSDASQELRRIQSRGLLQVERRGSFVYYHFGADPQVPSAEPLLKALKVALANTPEDQDGELAQIAAGLAHPRRITLARELARAPRTLQELQDRTNISQSAIRLHVQILIHSGMVRREGRHLALKPMDHPLARALASLLRG